MQRRTNVVEYRHLPGMPLQRSAFKFTAATPPMAVSENHGYGHATKEETFENDPDSRRRQIRTREGVCKKRDTRALWGNESDYCQNLAKSTSSDRIAE